MRTVVFLDLDDTIFQTAPKCPDGEAVRPVAYRRDGTPLSFMTERQRVLLETLSRGATVIPTTARNLDAFRRVDLPFPHCAILDFGGVVLLPGGALDRDWNAVIRPQAVALVDELNAMLAATQRLIGEQKLGANARVIVDFDMPLYLVVKHPEGDCSKLEPIREELRRLAGPQRFVVHANGNNVSLVPRFLGKEHAVRHVLRTQFAGEPVLTIGMGDSLSDAAFLDLCDYNLLPRGCQLLRHRSQKS